MTKTHDAERLGSYHDAVNLSFIAHKGQFRRDLAIPYWVHVTLVSATVAEWGGDADQIEAALIHDVIEDTDLTAGGVAALLGQDIADIAVGLTSSKDRTVSWKQRKINYIQSFLDERVNVKCYLAKLADMHSNMTSYVNSTVRLGKSTAANRTIDSYVVLSMVCLDKLSVYGTPAQYAVAKFNMQQVFSSLSQVNVTSVMLRDLDWSIASGEYWLDVLKRVWVMDEEATT